MWKVICSKRSRDEETQSQVKKTVDCHGRGVSNKWSKVTVAMAALFGECAKRHPLDGKLHGMPIVAQVREEGEQILSKLLC